MWNDDPHHEQNEHLNKILVKIFVKMMKPKLKIMNFLIYKSIREVSKYDLFSHTTVFNLMLMENKMTFS